MGARMSLFDINDIRAAALLPCIACMLAAPAAAYDLEQHEWRDRLLGPVNTMRDAALLPQNAPGKARGGRFSEPK
jgi:hypothetical protein